MQVSVNSLGGGDFSVRASARVLCSALDAFFLNSTDWGLRSFACRDYMHIETDDTDARAVTKIGYRTTAGSIGLQLYLKMLKVDREALEITYKGSSPAGMRWSGGWTFHDQPEGGCLASLEERVSCTGLLRFFPMDKVLHAEAAKTAFGLRDASAALQLPSPWPGASPPPRAVLVWDGRGSSRQVLSSLEERMEDAGIYLASMPQQFDAPLKMHSFKDEGTDALRALVAAGRKAFPGLPLFVGGFGIGGTVALCVAADSDLGVCGAAVMDPWLDSPSSAADIMAQRSFASSAVPLVAWKGPGVLADISTAKVVAAAARAVGKMRSSGAGGGVPTLTLDSQHLEADLDRLAVWIWAHGQSRRRCQLAHKDPDDAGGWSVTAVQPAHTGWRKLLGPLRFWRRRASS